MYREFSGGLVAELCSHQIDFVNWALDSTPTKVMGMGGIDYWKDGRETYDNIHLIYSYPNGVKAKFTCLTANAKNDYQIKVMGDKGTIILEYAKAWFYPEGNYNKKIGKLIDFRESIINNNNPKSGIRTGANAAICVQMGLDAMYNDKIVNWKPQYTI